MLFCMNCKRMWSIGILNAIISYSIASASSCPNPDDNTDTADSDMTFTRPPAKFTTFKVTSFGPYNLTVSWDKPSFEFPHGDNMTICHYNLQVSFLPAQKGSHMRTFHMNVNGSQLEATINELTPNTNVSVKLSACLLIMSGKYICAQPKVLTHVTSNTTDNCSLGLYYSAQQNVCVPCQCSNNSLYCESITGKCLDCLNNSQGNKCSSCISGYTQNPITKQCAPISDVHALNDTSTALQPVTSVCNSQSCFNGGTCIENANAIQKFRCRCQDGFFGLHCDMTPATESSLKPNTTYVRKYSDGLSSKFVIIASVSAVITIVLFVCISVIIYKKYGCCQKKPVPFWTLQSNVRTSVAFSDILEPQYSPRDDNWRLIENDFTHHRSLTFANEENPYRPLSA